jgi:DNA ligase-1
MHPMLLERKNPDTKTLQYPVMVFPKLDGIRCLVVDGVPKTRTLKDIPNKFIRSVLTSLSIDGFDGELIIGSPTSETVYRDTNSVVMAHDKISPFTYYAFDLWNSPGVFVERQVSLALKMTGLPAYIVWLKGYRVDNESQLLNTEQEFLEAGYEGLIIRAMTGKYKQGRTTLKENNTFKLKRFIDSEATIVGMVEEMENTNEKKTNELGRGQRSTEQAGMVGKSTMGALVVRDVNSGVEFQIGSGFTKEERQQFWDEETHCVLSSVIVKYKSFAIGVKDKPRHPIYLGLRDASDM